MNNKRNNKEKGETTENHEKTVSSEVHNAGQRAGQQENGATDYRGSAAQWTLGDSTVVITVDVKNWWFWHSGR